MPAPDTTGGMRILALTIRDVRPGGYAELRSTGVYALRRRVVRLHGVHLIGQGLNDPLAEDYLVAADDRARHAVVRRVVRHVVRCHTAGIGRADAGRVCRGRRSRSKAHRLQQCQHREVALIPVGIAQGSVKGIGRRVDGLFDHAHRHGRQLGDALCNLQCL